MPKAPRKCPVQGCENRITTTRYCTEHTVAWAGKRTESGHVTGTAAWKRLRLKVLARDGYQCQVRGPNCTVTAAQVDHVVNVAAGGPALDPANLQSICAACHSRKSQREATTARNAWKRSPEPHPGHRR